MASVIIPAHNEASVIGRCLIALLADARPGEFDVVVVANGCSDATARIACEHAPTATIVQRHEPSKSAALNDGDSRASSYPRLYLDADVQVSTETVRLVVDALRSGALLAAPRLVVNLPGRPWLVKGWYGTWLRLPYASQNLVGSGFYGLSQAGRARFGEFPDTMADDFFVRSRFRDDERVVVEGAVMALDAPYAVSGLLAARTRVAGANRADRGLFEASRAALRRNQVSALWALGRHPRRWPSLTTYLTIEVLARGAALWSRRRPGASPWRRDESARRHAARATAADAGTTGGRR